MQITVLHNHVSHPCGSCGLVLLAALSCLEKGRMMRGGPLLHLQQGAETRTGTLSNRTQEDLKKHEM